MESERERKKKKFEMKRRREKESHTGVSNTYKNRNLREEVLFLKREDRDTV